MGGAPENAAAGGVREGHRRRRLQRHHMGRGGGPVVPGHRARQGRYREAAEGASGKRNFQYCPLFGAPSSRILPPLGLRRRSRRHPGNGLLQKKKQKIAFLFFYFTFLSTMYFLFS